MSWSFVVPRIHTITRTSGGWLVPRNLTVQGSDSDTVQHAMELLGVLTPESRLLKPGHRLGYPLDTVRPASAGARQPDVTVVIDQPDATSATSTGETDNARSSYRLKTGPEGVTITAASRQGLAAGLSTLAQAIMIAYAGPWIGPLAPDLRDSISKEPYLRAVEIVDEAHYGWRGAMLDVARHFFPAPDVSSFLELLWLYRMSVFHWHLTDDQGWRFEIPELPALTEVGAWRDANTSEYGRYGGYYARSEIQTLVEYAQKRGLTVVPEIDVPGHASAAITAYPELSCRGVPVGVQTRWGIFPDVLCVGKESTYKFMDTVLKSVTESFPGGYIHIGGDEAPPDRWAQCEHCSRVMKERGIREPAGLHSYFVDRVVRKVRDLGLTPIVWDEVLAQNPPEGTIIAAWRDRQYGIDAAKAGYPVIMAPEDHACYLDHKHLNEFGEKGRISVCTVQDSATFDPAGAIPAEHRSHLLGSQANIWTEGIVNRRELEYMSLPRLSGLANIMWTGTPDAWPDTADRLELHRRLLALYGLSVYPGPMSQ